MHDIAEPDTYCGRVAIVGAPNVGKSSLINKLSGRSVSPVTYRPQTTRGTRTSVIIENDRQLILVDTPGFQVKHRHLLDQAMTRSVNRVLAQSIFAVFVVQIGRWTEAESRILKTIQQDAQPCILCVNKVDLEPDKDALLAMLQTYSEKYDFLELFPVSVHTGTNLNELRSSLLKHLPESPFEFQDESEYTEKTEFVIEEIVRKHLLLNLEQEIPHQAYVRLEQLRKVKDVTHLDVMIGVGKERVKPIVIGKSGATLKAIGTAARKELERRLSSKVMLKLWVKVDAEWYNDASKLHQMHIE